MSERGRKAGAGFEHEIGVSFEAYKDGGVALLAFMPVPTVVIRRERGVPLRVSKGKAPFDVYGYMVGTGRFVGAELKHSERSTSLAIIGPGRKGSGLQFHQLDALALLAQNGGVARIVWDNDGEIGILTEDEIIVAWRVFVETMKSEASGKQAIHNSKSIKWGLFTVVDYTNLHGVVAIDWLRQDLIQ